MPRTLRTAVLCAGFLLAMPAVPSAAFAASYLDEAVQALQSENVYVSPLAGGVSRDTEDVLEAQADSGNIAVVVLPAEAVNDTGGDPGQFLAEVARRTGYDTVVVSFGGNLEAGSSVLSAGQAGQIADQAEADNGSVQDALLDFVAEVNSIQGQAPATENGSESGGFLPIAGIVVVLALLAAGVVAYVRRRSRKPSVELPKLTVEGELRTALEEMQQLASRITDDPALRELALTWSSRTDELVNEIRRLLPDRINELSSGYAVDLGRVNKVLTRYLKAQDKPYSVDDPLKIKQDTKRSIEAYSDKVRKNLIRVSASEQLEFETAVAMLAPPTIRPQLDK